MVKWKSKSENQKWKIKTSSLFGPLGFRENHFQNITRAHNHDIYSRLCDFLSILN